MRFADAIAAARALERWLLPAECLLCREPVQGRDSDALICELCRARWRRVPPPWCARCGQPGLEGVACRVCTEWPAALGRVRSAVWLDGGAREAVHALWVDMDYAVRTERYKLVRRFRGERVASRAVQADGRPVLEPAVKLFDLAADAMELYDVADEPAYADIRADMERRLWWWLESVDDPILRGPVPTPFYRAAIDDFRRSAGR